MNSLFLFCFLLQCFRNGVRSRDVEFLEDEKHGKEVAERVSTVTEQNVANVFYKRRKLSAKEKEIKLVQFELRQMLAAVGGGSSAVE
jgi:hypothetical protein